MGARRMALRHEVWSVYTTVVRGWEWRRGTYGGVVLGWSGEGVRNQRRVIQVCMWDAQRLP